MSDDVVTRGDDAFALAANQVLAYLTENTPLTTWTIARAVDGQQVHVHANESDLVETGTVVAWDDTFCRRMVHGAANVVPDVLADPDYADVPMAKVARSYAGVPIADGRGGLFGTICGADPDPMAPGETVDVELLTFFADMLSHQLESARAIDAAAEASRRAHLAAVTDPLTGLLNRRGWDAVVVEAQRRLETYGDPVHVAMFDLDGLKEVNDAHGHDAGDALLRRAAGVMRVDRGPGLETARYGGDEFVALGAGCASADFGSAVAAVRHGFAAADVSASVGVATAVVGPDGVEHAVRVADAAMYEEKARRRRRRLARD